MDHHSIIAANHTFLWNKSNSTDSYESRILKKYDESLFKEYCIGDLSNFEKNKIALRWRTKKEVISGKGEFICGEKECNERENLTSWEVNFKYVEHGVQNNALVKIKLCEVCSWKFVRSKKNSEVHQKREIETRDKKEAHQTPVKEDQAEEFEPCDNSSVSVLKGINIFRDDIPLAESIDLYLNDLL